MSEPTINDVVNVEPDMFRESTETSTPPITKNIDDNDDEDDDNDSLAVIVTSTSEPEDADNGPKLTDSTRGGERSKI